jgi:hypothetical protein
MRHSRGCFPTDILVGVFNRMQAANVRVNDVSGGTMAQKPTTKPFEMVKTGDAQDAVWAIHHCLKYMSQDALDLGMSQTANLLEMIAHLALDEAKALRYRH